MAIDPNNTDAVAITQLDPLNPLSIATYLVGCNADGKMGNFTAEQLADIIAPYLAAYGDTPFVANTGSPLPNPITKATAITFVGAGIFDQTTGSDVETTEALNALFWASNGVTGTWTIGIEIPIVMTDYVSKVEGQDSLDVASQNFDRTTVDTLIARTFDPAINVPIFSDTAGTFSGWATSIGTPQNFNKIPLKLRTRTTPFTQISFRIFDIDANASIYDETRSGLSLSANTVYTLDFLFPLIANASGHKLRVDYLCNQTIDRWGFTFNTGTPFPNPPYTNSLYGQSGNMSFGSLTSTGTASRINFYEIYFSEELMLPSDQLLDEVEKGLNLDEVIQKVDLSIDLYNKFIQGQESFPRANAVLRDTISTFSGWATPVGVRTNFANILVPIKSRATAITSVYFELRKVSKTGDLITSGTKSVNIASNTSQDIVLDMGMTVVNSDNVELYFGYKCNQLCDAFGALAGSYPFPYPTYPVASYALSGSQTPGSWTDVGGGDSTRNLWIATGMLEERSTPTDDFLDEIAAKLPDAPTSDFVPYAEIIFPSRDYALEGKQCNIEFADIIESNISLDLLTIDVTCTKGAQFKERFILTPLSTDAGITPITITVSYDGQLLDTYSGNLYIASTASGTGVTRKINQFGDSLLAQGQPQVIIIAEQGTDPMTITPQGIVGTAPNVQEGRSGFRLLDLATAGQTLYKFPVTGIVIPPAIGVSVYSNNGSTFTVREINLSGGVGYISCDRTTGTNPPTTNGTLIRTAGTGDASIPYTGSTITSGNPLWNAGTSSVDYAMYLSNNGITMSANDWATIFLMINDLIAITDDATLATVINTRIAQLRTIIDNMQSAVSGLRIGIMTITLPSGQDGFGSNYQNTFLRDRYVKNVQAYNKRLIQEFDNVTEIGNKRYLIPFHSVLDTKKDYPYSLVPASSRVLISNTYGNLAAMSADLTPVNRSIAEVTSGISPGINAYFIKVGNTGAGFWREATSDDLFVIKQLNAVHPVQEPGFNKLGDKAKAVFKYYA